MTVYNEKLQTINILTGTTDYLEIGHLHLRNYSVLSLNLSYVEEQLQAKKNKLKFLGTIGMDIISQYTVRIDYSSKTIILNPDIAFAKSCSVNFHISNKLITLPVTLEGKTYRFMLDTGASACLIDKKIFNKNWENIDKEQNKYLIPLLTIGSMEFYKVPTVTGNANIIKNLDIDGIIGFPILSRQRIDLNFIENQLIFENVR